MICLFKRKSLAIMVIIILNGSVFAGVTGKIAGIVTDRQTSEALIGVNILLKIQRADGTVESTALGGSTDTEGEYFIINIPPGQYVVECSYLGYETVTQKNVRVSSDYTTKLNFQLGQQTLELDQVIEVTAQREMVRKDLTSSSVIVRSDEMEALPVREISDVLSLQAGIVEDAGGGLHIRGGRSSEIAYLVDGVQVLDPLTRASGISVDNQAVEELQAITGTFNAEYGQALSGVINIVTKRGSDRFRVNFTAYQGDYLSFDKTYSVMNNEEWANAAARAMTRPDRRLNYDFSPHDENSSEVLQQKKHLQKTKYHDSFNPLETRDYQLNLSGPLPFTNHRMTYFISARYNYNPGSDYGKRYFMPWGYASPAGDWEHTFKQPDNKLVPLSPYEEFSSQSKFFYNLSNSINVSYGLYFLTSQGKGGNYNYKYVPDAVKTNYTTSQTHILSMNHALSASSFYEFKVSYFQKDFENYLYEDPYDYRYMPVEGGDVEKYIFGGVTGTGEQRTVDIMQPLGDFAFYGNEVDRSQNNVSYVSAKWDLTSQINKRHLIKLGLEGRKNDLKNIYYSLQFDENYRPLIPPNSSRFYTEYRYHPKEFSGYIQDKIEFDDLIINFGLRFDYFDSDGKVLADPYEPQIYDPYDPANVYKNYDPDKPQEEWGPKLTYAERQKYWFKKAKAKYQLSPRFGLSFPITAQGVIHFSYGHFFQNPAFQYAYANPNWYISGAGAQNLIGNANIGPERTVMYEIGLQQSIWNDLYLHLTGFYRDIRDWIGVSSPIDTYQGTTYHVYENYDHATAKGIILATKYNTRQMSISLDYTYMIVKGTYSDPQEAYSKQSDPSQAPLVQLIAMPWDQRHSLVGMLGYNYQNWSGSLIGSLRSGMPYTPAFAKSESVGGTVRKGLMDNSENKPMTFNVDLRLSRRFHYFGLNYELMLNVYNLFDARNARNVYSDTGRPDHTENLNQYKDRDGKSNTVDLEISDSKEFYGVPGNYEAPRFIQLGLSVGL